MVKGLVYRQVHTIHSHPLPDTCLTVKRVQQKDLTSQRQALLPLQLQTCLNQSFNTPGLANQPVAGTFLRVHPMVKCRSDRPRVAAHQVAESLLRCFEKVVLTTDLMRLEKEHQPVACVADRCFRIPVESIVTGWHRSVRPGVSSQAGPAATDQ